MYISDVIVTLLLASGSLVAAALLPPPHDGHHENEIQSQSETLFSNLSKTYFAPTTFNTHERPSQTRSFHISRPSHIKREEDVEDINAHGEDKHSTTTRGSKTLPHPETHTGTRAHQKPTHHNSLTKSHTKSYTDIHTKRAEHVKTFEDVEVRGEETHSTHSKTHTESKTHSKPTYHASHTKGQSKSHSKTKTKTRSEHPKPTHTKRAEGFDSVEHIEARGGANHSSRSKTHTESKTHFSPTHDASHSKSHTKSHIRTHIKSHTENPKPQHTKRAENAKAVEDNEARDEEKHSSLFSHNETHHSKAHTTNSPHPKTSQHTGTKSKPAHYTSKA